MLPSSEHRFIKTIFGEPVDRTPLWIMRQAGRYLPEYRATREKAGSFMTLCKTPELACEVTLQPLRRYDLDASIIFSDILTIPDAMGLGLSFVESKGPQFERYLRSEHDIKALAPADLNRLTYVYDAIRLVTHELAGKLPLIGFCGSPWTLAAYMVDGESKSGFQKALGLMQENPRCLHHLLEMLATSVAAHLNAQIEAGASAVMLFDTWGGLLSTSQYHEFSLRYLKLIIDELKRANAHRKLPIILFTKGGGAWLPDMADTGCDMLGLDWETPLDKARALVGHKVALQGNMNPACLLSSPDNIRKEAAAILASYGQGSGHVFNLGHGITPDVPPEHVQVLVEAVKEFSQGYHP